MNQKPGDFFLSVIDFVGMLVPGAILFFLHPDLICKALGFPVCGTSVKDNWIPAFLVSFIRGI